jgi:hypothetical protein
MDEDLKRVSKTYAARYSLTLAKRLGSGIHGIVLVAQSKLQPGRTALKLHRDFTAYDQEKRVLPTLAPAIASPDSGLPYPLSHSL